MTTTDTLTTHPVAAGQQPADDRDHLAGLLADAGYQGLSTQTAGAVITPRPARRKNQLPVPPALAAAREAERRAHSSSGSVRSTASAT